MLGLLPSADSVELKVTVPEEGQRSSVAALGMDPLDAQIRQVFFFDTPDLALDQAGVVVRARRVQGKGDDSVVKLRPVVPAELPAQLRRSPAFGVEVDAMPGGFVCSGSMKRALGTAGVGAVAGDRPLRKLFSKEQRAFFAEHAPEGVDFDDLGVLGPDLRAQAQVGRPPASPAGSSPSCGCTPTTRASSSSRPSALPAEAFQVAAELRAYLGGRGVDLAGEQQTKTRRALEFFSAAPRRCLTHVARTLRPTRGRAPRARGSLARHVLGGEHDRHRRLQPVAAEVDQWLSRFEDALTEGDSAAAAELFADDGFWRDLVAFTWNIKTVEGPDGRQGHARPHARARRSRAAFAPPRSRPRPRA